MFFSSNGWRSFRALCLVGLCLQGAISFGQRVRCDDPSCDAMSAYGGVVPHGRPPAAGYPDEFDPQLNQPHGVVPIGHGTASCSCSECQLRRRQIIIHHCEEEKSGCRRKAIPENARRFNEPAMVPPGNFLAPPRTGDRVEGHRSIEIRGLGLKFPELKLALPSIELPGLVRRTRAPQMELDRDVAPFRAVQQPAATPEVGIRQQSYNAYVAPQRSTAGALPETGRGTDPRRRSAGESGERTPEDRCRLLEAKLAKTHSQMESVQNQVTQMNQQLGIVAELLTQQLQGGVPQPSRSGGCVAPQADCTTPIDYGNPGDVRVPIPTPDHASSHQYHHPNVAPVHTGPIPEKISPRPENLPKPAPNEGSSRYDLRTKGLLDSRGSSLPTQESSDWLNRQRNDGVASNGSVAFMPQRAVLARATYEANWETETKQVTERAAQPGAIRARALSSGPSAQPPAAAHLPRWGSGNRSPAKRLPTPVQW